MRERAATFAGRRGAQTIKFVIEQAQGESALEEFLNEISSALPPRAESETD